MHPQDTIAAISSATGAAARMIVRMSGGHAIAISEKLVNQTLEHSVTRASVCVRECSFPAWVYLFRSPRSVTSQDVVEFHIPGNPLLAQWMLEAMISHGARQADAGEFTARAYFSGKLDLSQAEGVAAAVSANSQAELSAARQLLNGELSRRLRPIMEEIAHTLALVEAGIDFTEEDINFISAEDAVTRMDGVISSLNQLIAESPRFEPLTHMPKVVLVGRPNAGKSTLLNALAGHERAVVSPVAGTTRDVLSAQVVLRRGTIQLFDVAGLEEALLPLPLGEGGGEGALSKEYIISRKAPPHPNPLPEGEGTNAHTAKHKVLQQQLLIEREMQQRARGALEEADFIVLVQDSTDASQPIPLPREPDLVVLTKTDLPRSVGVSPPTGAGVRKIFVSVITCDAMPQLRETLDQMAFSSESRQTLALNARHLHCINACIDALTRAKTSATQQGSEILAMDLRESLDALGRVLGEVTPDDVLGRIFATFCIGK